MKPLTIDDCFEKLKQANSLEEWLKWEKLLRSTIEFETMARQKQREFRRTLQRLKQKHAQSEIA